MSKRSRKPHPGGRPPTYDPQRHPLQVERCIANALTVTDTAAVIGISRETLYAWSRAHPEFSDKFASARAIALNRVGSRLYKRAEGYTKVVWEERLDREGNVVKTRKQVHVPPDPTSAMFILCNRAPDDWKSVQKIEHSGSVEQRHTLDLARLSDAELVAYRELIAKAGAPKIEAVSEQTIEVEAEEAE